MINRRGLITGLISFVAAPAIVRATNIMPVKAIPGGTGFNDVNVFKPTVASDLSPDRLERLHAMLCRQYRITRRQSTRTCTGIGDHYDLRTMPGLQNGDRKGPLRT